MAEVLATNQLSGSWSGGHLVILEEYHTYNVVRLKTSNTDPVTKGRKDKDTAKNINTRDQTSAISSNQDF